MPSVLVVDDSPLDRRLAMSFLKEQGDLKVEGAAHGAQALSVMARELPDIVVTDLQMPDMNGLDLVRAIRGQYPLVPVVLMTAHGSEEIAVQALEQGAASYVPKAKLAKGLAETVRHVLALARADRHHDRLLDCLQSARLSFVLETHPDLIDPLADHLQQQISRLNFCDETDLIRVGIALQEALLNACYHGNLEVGTEAWRQGLNADTVERRLQNPPYLGRKIYVFADLSTESIRFVIRDEGPGFVAPPYGVEAVVAGVEDKAGRGLILMRAFMDEVSFNAAGNEVTMVKRREPAKFLHEESIVSAAR